MVVYLKDVPKCPYAVVRPRRVSSHACLWPLAAGGWRLRADGCGLTAVSQ
jgi:hypothetical protein